MAKVLTILAAAMMITTTVQAEPLDAKKLGTFCTHLSQEWWKAIKCGYVAAGSTSSMHNARQYEFWAEEATDPDKATKYRNKAAYERLEAERYADEYRRKYAPK